MMARFSELEKKAADLISRAIDSGETPCANMMIIRKDELICYAQAGKTPEQEGKSREILSFACTARQSL